MLCQVSHNFSTQITVGSSLLLLRLCWPAGSYIGSLWAYIQVWCRAHFVSYSNFKSSFTFTLLDRSAWWHGLSFMCGFTFPFWTLENICWNSVYSSWLPSSSCIFVSIFWGGNWHGCGGVSPLCFLFISYYILVEFLTLRS